MKTKHIFLILIPINIFLGFLIYNSINSEVKFQDEAQIRLSQNIQKLKDLRHVQMSYKRTNGTFANNFEDLISFLESDSIPIIKANGETPDSLTESEALKLGIISRDTAYVLAKEGVFNKEYIESRDNCIEFNLKALTTVPHSNMNYNIDAGEIEKGKVIVQVFEISSNYATIFTGLNAKNKSYNLNSLLKVGSMQEASLNGNWGE
tara:strand:- start:34489 stop:35106 length:618 start_codon:yes stop_codon:yes gene_type:complete